MSFHPVEKDSTRRVESGQCSLLAATKSPVMSGRDTGRGAEYYRELIRPLDTHPDWRRTEASPAVDDAVARAVNGGLGELFYQHNATSARLHVRIPAQTTSGALDALLNQPLDPHMSERGPPDTFTARVSTAHYGIADTYRTAYTRPATDPSLIVTVAVPVEWKTAVWAETIRALSRTAAAVDELHTALEQLVRNFEPDAG